MQAGPFGHRDLKIYIRCLCVWQVAANGARAAKNDVAID